MKVQRMINAKAILKCFCITALIVPVLAFRAISVPLNYDVTRTTGITYNSISGTGIVISSWRNPNNSPDDNLSNAIPIGFPFPYQGNSYSTVLVSTNGFITFNTATAAIGNGSGAYGAANGNFSSLSVSSVAPFYDDLTSQSLTTSFRYLTTGPTGNRIFTVEWIGMDYQSTGANLNFQVKLYEAFGNIEFVYGTMSAFDGSHNQTYSYSSGINASSITLPPASGELLTQETQNTRNFGFASSNSLNITPQCFSSILFTPGSYTPYVPVNQTVVNDNSSGAIQLGVNSSPCTDFCGTYYSSAGATQSGVAVCTGLQSDADDDVWFSFVATNPSTSIRVRGSGGYNTVVELLNNSMTSLGCQNAAGAGLLETINATGLTNGSTYYIRVYHSGSGSGTTGVFSICINATPLPPVNDDCAGAINLPVTLSQTLIAGTSTTAATASSGIPTPCLSTVPDDDVWYKFTAVTSSVTVLVQSGSGFDAAVQAFSGPCGSLASVQCVNASPVGGSETISLSNLTINAVYFVRVFHAFIGSGTGSFSIVAYSTVPPCPDPTVFSPPSNNYIPASGVTLRWKKALNTTSYDVYLDTQLVGGFPVNLLASNVTDTSRLSGPLLQGKIYYWNVVAKNALGNSGSCTVHLFATTPPDLIMTVKVFIEGLYIGNRTMIAAVDPDNHAGTVADTITVALARNVPPFDVQYSVKTTLSTSGVARCAFPYNTGFQYYYIAVYHRNSMETWSYQPFGFLIDYGDTIFDFTTSAAAGNHRPSGPVNSKQVSLDNSNPSNRDNLNVINRKTETDLLKEEE
jgi:hypothetical protein